MQRAADGKGKAEMQMQIETNKTTKGIPHMVWPAGRCTHMLDIVHRTPDRSVWFALMASRSVGALANYRSYNILFRVFGACRSTIKRKRICSSPTEVSSGR